MRLSAILCAGGALALALFVAPRSARAEGWFNELAKPVDLTIGELLAKPDDYTEREVRIKVVYRGEGDVWNPYYTRFDNAAFANIAVWPWNARIFEKRDYLNSYPLFYVTKGEDGGRLWKKLTRLDPCTGIEIEGIVEDVWMGKPSVEITDFRVISGQLDEEGVQAAARGDAFYEAGRFAEAEEAYDDAISSRLDDWLEAELYRRRGDAEFRQGKYREARNSYDYALDRAEDNDVLRSAYNAADARYEAERQGGKAGDAPPARFVPTFGDGSNDVDLVIAAFAPSSGEQPAEEAAEAAPTPKAQPVAPPKAQPAPKVEPKPEPKPEPKVEPKVEPKPEPQPAPKVEPKPEPKPEPKAEPKPEPVPEPMPEPQPEPLPEPVDVGKLPMLPFFGCENVTQDQLRAILVDIARNPESFE